MEGGEKRQGQERYRADLDRQVLRPTPSTLHSSHYTLHPSFSFEGVDRLRVGTRRAEGAQGTPAQSHISPSILVYDDEGSGFSGFRGLRASARVRT